MEGVIPNEVWLYTDIEGSTRLWQAYPLAMPEAYRLHDEIIRHAIVAEHGEVATVVGDAFQARFPSGERAVMAAIRAQRRLQAAAWPLPEPFRVRMAIHAAAGGHDVPALTIRHELGMVLGAAHGDQIIGTGAAVSRADAGYGDRRWRELGRHLVRGMAEETSLYQVIAEGLCDAFPPLRTRFTHPHNLPAIPAERHCELIAEAEVRDHFEGGSRWVTLVDADLERARATGISSAWALLSRFPDGAFLTEVNSSLTRAIHFGIGIDPDTESTIDELVAMIGRRHLLLVFSGMETNVDGVTELAELLAQCPMLHVIVAATGPLRSRWERVVYLQDS